MKVKGLDPNRPGVESLGDLEQVIDSSEPQFPHLKIGPVVAACRVTVRRGHWGR